MKYIVAVIVIALVIWGFVFWSGNQTTPTTAEPIKIGFIGPLTGDGAPYGETEKNAILLALEDLASKPDAQKLEMIYEDGKCSGKDATSAIQKLISIDKVKIVLGGVCSAETLAAAPIAEQNQVLMFSAFSSHPDISKAGNYIFRNSPKDTDVAHLDASTIAQKYKKVAMVSENTDYSIGVREIMKNLFSEKEISIVADELYSGGSAPVTDFRSILTKIKSSQPEVLYVNPGTSAKVGGLIVKQARELGITVPIHGNFSLGTADALATGGEYMNGVVISDSSGLADTGKDLIARYKIKFAKDPANEFEMGASYDRITILTEAIKKVGYDTDKIRNYLYNLA
ncbi:MAG TPA: ABC transporter substrate-binding protein, partial [Candidatus Paceibacterota bacterium]